MWKKLKSFFGASMKKKKNSKEKIGRGKRKEEGGKRICIILKIEIPFFGHGDGKLYISDTFHYKRSKLLSFDYL